MSPFFPERLHFSRFVPAPWFFESTINAAIAEHVAPNRQVNNYSELLKHVEIYSQDFNYFLTNLLVKRCHPQSRYVVGYTQSNWL